MPDTTPRNIHSAAPARPAPRRRALPALMLLICLVLAIVTVLLVPNLTGEATAGTQARPQSRQPESAAPVSREAVTYEGYDEAAAQLAFSPRLPEAIPEGYGLTAVRVLDGSILELEYSTGRDTLVYRTAEGNEDLSDTLTEFAYSATTEASGVTRTYAGAGEEKLNLAVWAEAGYTFALVSQDGVAAAEFVAMAESV